MSPIFEAEHFYKNTWVEPTGYISCVCCIQGVFYQRFVLGRWVAVHGAVYPFMDDEKMYCEVPDVGFDDFAVSCDYGTTSPASFGLWGEKIPYGIELRSIILIPAEGYQRTDEEHYAKLEELVGNRKVSRVVVDPSAAGIY